MKQHRLIAFCTLIVIIALTGFVAMGVADAEAASTVLTREAQAAINPDKALESLSRVMNALSVVNP